MTTPKTTKQEPLEATSRPAGDTIDNPPAKVTVDRSPVSYAEGGSLVTADDEFGDVDDFDLSPPDPTRTGLLGIPLLQMDRNIGKGFVDEDTGEVSMVLPRLIWGAKATSRAYFDKKYDPKNVEPPVCRSADGFKPDPSSPSVQHETCAGCPQNQWVDGKPKCRESIEALVYLPDEADGSIRIARMRFAGIALKWARSYWDSFKTRLPRQRPIAMVTRVELVEEDTDFGKKLSPRFHRVQELNRTQAQPLIDETRRRMDEWRAAVAEDVATASAADHDDTANGRGAGSPAGGPFGDEGEWARDEPPPEDQTDSEPF